MIDARAYRTSCRRCRAVVNDVFGGRRTSLIVRGRAEEREEQEEIVR